MNEPEIDREAHARLCEIARREGKERWSERFPDDPQAVVARLEAADAELAEIGRLGMARAHLTQIAIRDAAAERGIPTTAYSVWPTSVVHDALGLDPLDPVTEGLDWRGMYFGTWKKHLQLSVGCGHATRFARSLPAAEATRSFLELRRERAAAGVFYKLPEQKWPPHYNTTEDCSYQDTVEIIWDPVLPEIAIRHGDRLPRIDTPSLLNPSVLFMLHLGGTERCRFLGGRRGRALLERMKPESVAELAATVALNRPGDEAVRLVNLYTERKHEPLPAPTSFLQEVIAETRGILLYTEQVNRLLAHVGMTSLTEMKTLRLEVIFEGARRIRQLRKIFDAGRVRGLPDEEVDSIAYLICERARSVVPKSYYLAAVWMLLAEVDVWARRGQFPRAY